MKVKDINHLLFSVSDLDRSIEFYETVLEAKLLVKGRTTAYFDLNGIWLALNLEKDIPRNEIKESYTHIAFTIDKSDFDSLHQKLIQHRVTVLPGRSRDKKTRNPFTSQIRTDTSLSFIQELFRTGLSIIRKRKNI